MSKIHDEARVSKEARDVLQLSKDVLDGKLAQNIAIGKIFALIRNEQNPSLLLKEMSDSSKFPSDFPHVTIDGNSRVEITLNGTDKDVSPKTIFAIDEARSARPPSVSIPYRGFSAPDFITVNMPGLSRGGEVAFDAVQTAKDFFDGKMTERQASGQLLRDLDAYKKLDKQPEPYVPVYANSVGDTLAFKQRVLNDFFYTVKNGTSRLPDYPSTIMKKDSANSQIIMTPGKADNAVVRSEPGSSDENRAVEFSFADAIAAKFPPQSWFNPVSSTAVPRNQPWFKRQPH